MIAMDGLTILGERRWDLQIFLCGTGGMSSKGSVFKGQAHKALKKG